ncbi:defensin-like protein [Solanum dulcamara]|uniref:defensin-like protein n=1 Tax=Solanum dulcamara TaxID=45834 RepID=UPI002484EBBE|nr:defensin-like protein [Solanum dulcamara]
MGNSMRYFATFFLVAMMFLATEMGPMSSAEARICESQSQSFKGACVSDTNCASVCHSEGFIGGKCRGLRRRCFCTKNC